VQVPEPIRRTTARFVPVNRDGDVLLPYGRDPAVPDERIWFTIGGAAEPGNSLREAGVRELQEETGFVAITEDLVGPFRRGLHELSRNARQPDRARLAVEVVDL
jgi:8-oxo-dGTP pyrophosphatase MutT (NUDIX family)